ncbi:hypothetical protein [Leisingera sp. JC11]|uniref:hypothetical protein n=1 Tax=Leisingera sp. JC11 TaxID=3042469 RepID=UPI003453EA00
MKRPGLSGAFSCKHLWRKWVSRPGKQVDFSAEIVYTARSLFQTEIFMMTRRTGIAGQSARHTAARVRFMTR